MKKQIDQKDRARRAWEILTKLAAARRHTTYGELSGERMKSDCVYGTVIRACGELSRKLARFFRNSPNMKTSIHPVLITVALICFAVSPQARAVCREGCDLFHSNTFLGADALLSNTSGESNTAIGGGALTSNTTGFDNTANGSTALFYNTSGYANTANGAFALFLNTSGSDNTAVGTTAVTNNITGGANTAVGVEARA